jgi:hypothetical protein
MSSMPSPSTSTNPAACPWYAFFVVTFAAGFAGDEEFPAEEEVGMKNGVSPLLQPASAKRVDPAMNMTTVRTFSIPSSCSP